MSIMLDVICIGQAVIDCITREKEETPYKPNVYRASTIELHTGGDAVNEAIALSELGCKVSLLCVLGKDMAGDIIFHEVSKHNVITDLIQFFPITTPIANLQVNTDGSRISINSNATKLEGSSLSSVLLPNAKIVSFASLFRPPLTDLETVKNLMHQAHQNGSIICVDTKLPLSENITLEQFKEVLPLIDYFFPNENEARYYSNETEYSKIASIFHSYGIKNVIVKLGEKGCYISGKDNAFHLNAIPAENIKDTTGAGDHFVAGFINGLLHHKDLYECGLEGSIEASKAISHTGGSI